MEPFIFYFSVLTTMSILYGLGVNIIFSHACYIGDSILLIFHPMSFIRNLGRLNMLYGFYRCPNFPSNSMLDSNLGTRHLCCIVVYACCILFTICILVIWVPIIFSLCTHYHRLRFLHFSTVEHLFGCLLNFHWIPSRVVPIDVRFLDIAISMV